MQECGSEARDDDDEFHQALKRNVIFCVNIKAPRYGNYSVLLMCEFYAVELDVMWIYVRLVLLLFAPSAAVCVCVCGSPFALETGHVLQRQRMNKIHIHLLFFVSLFL